MSNKISVIVPVFNEAVSVVPLHAEIVTTMKLLGRNYEIIFVDDGSIDDTYHQLISLAPIKVIRLRKNFGQTAALDAGIKVANGDYLVMLDGDGQNDPNDIPRLIAELERKNLDLISGWRKDRKDSFMKKFSSRCAGIVRKLLLDDGIHDSGCTLKVYRRKCFDHVELVGEMHRFIPALLKIKGFTIGELPVNHRPRRAGQTKYTWARGLKGILDMMAVWFWTKYAGRPLHLFGGLGILLIGLATLGGGVAVYQKIFAGQDLSSTALMPLALFVFLIGVQFLVFGLLGDIVLKTYFATSKDTRYDIKESLENYENPHS
ncbi:MAG: glycosyltransferase family 2 protein [Patescibacteria group bacterium]